MRTDHTFLPAYNLLSLSIRVLFIALSLSIAGCFADKKSSSSSIEMIVVFNKDVQVEKANSIMFEKGYIFREGSDSSKGKRYFIETGPKFIVAVPKDKLDLFADEMKGIPQIFEVYRADWRVNKD